jgi:hypothetical protein
MEINDNMRMGSFDIENMYTNSPKSDILNTVKNALKINPEAEKITPQK